MPTLPQPSNSFVLPAPIKAAGGQPAAVSDEILVVPHNWHRFDGNTLDDWLQWLRTYRVGWSSDLFWHEGGSYGEGDLAVHNGSLWLRVRLGPPTTAGPHNEPGVIAFGWGRIASAQVTEGWAEAGDTTLIPSSKLGNAVDHVADWAEPGNTDRIPRSKLVDILSDIYVWAWDDDETLIPASKLANAVDHVANWAEEGNTDRIPRSKLFDILSDIYVWAWDDDETLIPASKLANAPPTNLSYSRSATGLTIISSTGGNVTLPLADEDNAGLMSPVQFELLDGPQYRGEWTGAVTYDEDELVWYFGELYVCTQAHTSGSLTSPHSSDSSWRLLASYKGAWSNTTYQPGSIVSHDSNLWMNTAVAFPQSSAYHSEPGRYTVWAPIGGQEAVARWALASDATLIPLSKLPASVASQSTDLSVSLEQTYIDLESSTGQNVRIHQADRNNAGWLGASDYRKLSDLPSTVHTPATWARAGNTDIIPSSKLPAASGGDGASSIFRGNWSGSETYQRGEMVFHGDLYVCRTNAHQSGWGPNADSTNWEPVSEYRGEWNTSTWYHGGNVVKRSITDNGVTTITLYMALEETGPSDAAPESNATQWHKLTSLSLSDVDARIAPWARVGQTAPGGAADGTVDGVFLTLSEDDVLTITVSLTVGEDVSGTLDLSELIGGEDNVQPDWDESDTGSDAYIQNKPTLFVVHGTPGNGQVPKWNATNSRSEWADDAMGTPGSGEANVQADWDVTDTGSDAYIQNKPTIPAAQVRSDWDATSGLAQILNKPSIPAAQVRSDWNATTGVSVILNKPTIPRERWRGNWSAGVYAAGDVVRDTWNNRLYWCVSATTAADTTRPNADATHWARVSALSNTEVDARIASWARAGQTAPSGAGEVNVQADWDETDTGNDAFIQNKPTVPPERWKGSWAAGVYAIGSVVKDTDDSQLYWCISATTASDTDRPSADATHWVRISGLSGAEIADLLDALSGDDRLQYSSLRGLPSIPGNAEIDARIATWARAGQDAPSGAGEVNVQANWDETDANDDAYIQNKPDVRIYRGAWAAANAYVQGQMVAHSSHVWIALNAVAANEDAPGSDDDTNWRRLDHLTDSEVESLINSHVATWAQDGNSGVIPAGKVPDVNLGRTLSASSVVITSSRGNDATIGAAAYTPANGNPGDADYVPEVSAAGVMTGADRQKFDGVEVGATADQTGAEIADLLEALTGNDRLQYASLRGTPTIPGNGDIDARIADWAENGNSDAIPATKLGNAPDTQANWTETDTTDPAYIQNKPTIPGERFRGSWSGTTEYDRGDLVYRNSDLWFCLTDDHTSTTAPERDSANWRSLSGYVGTWAAGVYREGDLARDSYDGQWYFCIAGTDATHGRPSSDSARWSLLSNPFRGNFSGSTRYQRGNIVWHSNHLWICRTNNHQSGWGPNSDAVNWDPITIYRGNWSTGWYEPGDMVTDTDDSQIYLCISDATNSDGRPSTDATRWKRISNPTDTEIDARIESWAQEGSTEEIPSDKLPDQVKSDWDETDTSSPGYIENKPTIPTIPAGVSATSLLGDWTIAMNHTTGHIVGDTTPPSVVDYVYTVIPSSGRVRITVCHTKVSGITEVAASCLRDARMDTRIGKILQDGSGLGYIGFYCDDNNRLYARQDIGVGFSNARIIVQHIDDGLLPESS